MLVRLAGLFVPAALAALAWVGVCRALGLGTALTVAGAVLAGCGGVLAMAVCLVGAGQTEPIEDVEQESPRTVTAEQQRFTREEARSRGYRRAMR